MTRKSLLLAVTSILLLGACDVSRDATNDTTTLSVDEDRVANTAEDVGNLAGRAADEAGEALQNAGPAIENAAETVGERAERVGAKAEDAVERVDVDVSVRNANEPDKR
ncbi:hypothetical protein ACFQPG_09480 [Sphingomonas sp. GCM10030256]|uniref:hypothetical protein n=1 Tax=Sphingomonas sp. GCM10030256 TaxID=3273427 RepID=UPI00360F93D1